MHRRMVMLKTSKITALKSSPRVGNDKRIAVALTWVIAAAMLIMPGCQRKPVMSHASFVSMPATGWQQAMPLTFAPEYDDSSRVYRLTLAVRHDNSYPYRNLSLVVDAIAADSTVNRQTVDMTLADEYGNWTGGGFGTLYQKAVTIAHGIRPADVRSVVIWQSAQGCDTLHGLVNVGIITSPDD